MLKIAPLVIRMRMDPPERPEPISTDELFPEQKSPTWTPKAPAHEEDEES
jgi:hypothetical protein